MQNESAIVIENLRYSYGERVAIDGLSQNIPASQMFVILGPNGSGKSTLFKLLSTLVPLQSGDVTVAGFSVRTHAAQVRQSIGVVFQYPSLDKKLSVRENIDCQASLVGLFGRERRQRVDDVMRALSLNDRANDRAEKLSGGLKRRVELAKGILNRPAVLLLDEPSTGLDPSARLEFWAALERLKGEAGTSIVMTSHLLEEADKADQIAIMNRGKLVAQDSPENLRRVMGDSMITIRGRRTDYISQLLNQQFGWTCRVLQNEVKVDEAGAVQRVGEVSQLLGEDVESVTVSRPSLEDVFVARTGESFGESTSG